MLDFSKMTPAQIRIKKLSLMKEQESFRDMEDPVAFREYSRLQNEIAQCLCALHTDSQLEYLGIDREAVVAEAMRYAILNEMGVRVEDVEFMEDSFSFTLTTWQSVSAMVRKFQHKVDIKIESFMKGTTHKGGGYKITAIALPSQNILAA